MQKVTNDREMKVNASLVWIIVVKSAKDQMGSPIKATGWDVLSKLAAVKNAIPMGWTAEAYPQFAER